MRIPKINSTISNLNKPLKPIKRKKDDLLQQCSEVRHKQIKDLSVNEIPVLGAFIGLFTPLPFGFLIGFGVGKGVELLVKAFKKNKKDSHNS